MDTRSTAPILLIGDDDSLHMALEEAGFSVVSVAETEDLYSAVSRIQPSVVLVQEDSPTRDTLEHLALSSRRFPQPTLLLHDGQNAELTEQALKLGISPYVIEGMSATAMRALIDVSIGHQRQIEVLRQELSRSQKSLAERKVIDAAKCALMEREKASEAEAFRRLKTLAMNCRISLTEGARRILSQTEP